MSELDQSAVTRSGDTQPDDTQPDDERPDDKLPAASPDDPSAAPGSRVPAGLIALAIGGFGIGLTEFVISGLLTDVSVSLGVSVPTAGALIWSYALAVAVGAFTVTAALTRRPPKSALLILLVVFVVGNAITALAPGFELALVGRIVTAMCHGGYFGIGAVMAADLVPPHRRAGAIAIMFGGLTSANVFGVPFGTFVGQNLGWRAAFWVVAAVGVVAFVGILALVPDRPAPPQPAGSAYRVLLRPQVVVSVALTMLMFGGLFGAFIYVEPLVTNVTGFSSGAVPWLLVLFGLGLFVGNLAGGWLADRNLPLALRGLPVLLTASLVVYGLVAHWQIPTAVMLFVIGAVGFATSPPLQLRVIRFASDAPTMASAANIAAFNVGNAIGTLLGGLAISVGLGWVSPVWMGAGMVVAAAVLAFATGHRPADN
ncbi:MFS transporter [Gordonia soli]|uniref:Putative major facilitator superfamily transporter n=1 Tax=Gordonia soli NBRC 108243 TaxID=1223545 RepID=M0QK38_9ACTN|nr:MFS transporter [Gordonia soli]GAC68814.1 putative major facilitator superfamily transporter [Gordonia soli NBRC 108243]